MIKTSEECSLLKRSSLFWLMVGLLHLLCGVLFFSHGYRPEQAGLLLLAYSFGLRHAFDLDHIAAIDNSVRRLLQADKPSQGTGFYFSLGHSTIVFVLSVGLAFASVWVRQELPVWQSAGSLLGTAISCLFLIILGFFNLVLLFELLGWVKTPRAVQPQGLMGRLLFPILRRVGSAGQLFVVGLLFGLGFDTASEVALLTLSANVSVTLPWTVVLSFPLAFASGMSLMDTADGIAMTKAYAWSSRNPRLRKIYNIAITGASVLMALAIGLGEARGLFAVLWGNSAAWVGFGVLVLAGVAVLTGLKIHRERKAC